MAGNSATISVLAHALDIEKDRRENNELGEQTVSALFGVPSNVELIGDAIPADGPYGIRCKDDLDTCVVSGRLPDVLRCLIAGSLKAPANDQLHISATSKLEPSFHESNGDMKVRIAPQKLEGHPVHRWGHSFAVLNIMDRGYLYCFPGKLNSDKLDMAIFQMVLWTLLRGSPPGAPTDVVQEAVHSSGSSVPTGQPFSALLAKIFEEEWHTPLRLFSQQEKASLNPQKAYTALPARELDRLASALEDERVVGRILDLTLGADWEQERPGILYFITKQVHG